MAIEFVLRRAPTVFTTSNNNSSSLWSAQAIHARPWIFVTRKVRINFSSEVPIAELAYRKQQCRINLTKKQKIYVADGRRCDEESVKTRTYTRRPDRHVTSWDIDELHRLSPAIKLYGLTGKRDKKLGSQRRILFKKFIRVWVTKEFGKIYYVNNILVHNSKRK